MLPHRKRAPSRGPFRSGNQAVLLWCSACRVTLASHDAREYLGLEVVGAAGWRPIERWREKLKTLCPRAGCDTRVYRVCARHEELEVIYELCPECELILFEDGDFEKLIELMAAAHAAPKLRKPRKPRSFIDELRGKTKKKKKT